MKKVLTLLTLSMIITKVIAQKPQIDDEALKLLEPAMVASIKFVNEEAAEAFFAKEEQKLQEVRENMKKGITDDMTLKEAISTLFRMPFTIEEPVSYTRDLVQKIEIPHKRVMTVLEDMIREKKIAIEKGKGDSVNWNISELLLLLGTFPDYDILPLIKEYLSTSKSVNLKVVKVFVYIEGEKSLPLLRDLIDKENLTGVTRVIFFEHLERVSIPLKKENKTSEAEKFAAFLNEMKQAERAKEKGED
jgi:hypothetical protein